MRTQPPGDQGVRPLAVVTSAFVGACGLGCGLSLFLLLGYRDALPGAMSRSRALGATHQPPEQQVWAAIALLVCLSAMTGVIWITWQYLLARRSASRSELAAPVLAVVGWLPGAALVVPPLNIWASLQPGDPHVDESHKGQWLTGMLLSFWWISYVAGGAIAAWATYLGLFVTNDLVEAELTQAQSALWLGAIGFGILTSSSFFAICVVLMSTFRKTPRDCRALR